MFGNDSCCWINHQVHNVYLWQMTILMEVYNIDKWLFPYMKNWFLTKSLLLTFANSNTWNRATFHDLLFGSTPFLNPPTRHLFPSLFIPSPCHRSKTTRFRWVQPERFNRDDTWALRWIYIGDECDCSCAGHGRCDHGTCQYVQSRTDNYTHICLYVVTSHLSDLIIVEIPSLWHCY